MDSRFRAGPFGKVEEHSLKWFAAKSGFHDAAFTLSPV
jgi:hypothetical protein